MCKSATANTLLTGWTPKAPKLILPEGNRTLLSSSHKNLILFPHRKQIVSRFIYVAELPSYPCAHLQNQHEMQKSYIFAQRYVTAQLTTYAKSRAPILSIVYFQSEYFINITSLDEKMREISKRALMSLLRKYYQAVITCFTYIFSKIIHKYILLGRALKFRYIFLSKNLL